MKNHPDIWIGTSWKMNKTLAQANAFVTGLIASEPTHNPRIQRFIIPPFTSTREVKTQLQNTSVKVGAQNMHWDDFGAWTGEISPIMLTDCHLDIVELGHSERRKYFGETDETVGLKTRAAIRHKLIPLICIGETLAERKAGQTEEILKKQINGALQFLNITEVKKTLLFAYEPVWAIGKNGIPASADYANEQHKLIIQTANSILGRKISCLYGGSVTLDNCEELIQCDHINGLFIGRSAWDVADYLKILSLCSAKI